jgi:hypothetical protein
MGGFRLRNSHIDSICKGTVLHDLSALRRCNRFATIAHCATGSRTATPVNVASETSLRPVVRRKECRQSFRVRRNLPGRQRER